MTIGQALGKHLLLHAGLKAVVKAKIYPGLAPLGTNPPYVEYRKTDDQQSHSFGTDSGPYMPVYEVTSWGKTLSEAYSAAAQVKAALKDYKGTMGGVGGVVVTRVLFDSENENIPDYPDEYYGIEQEYQIDHQ